MTAPLPSASLVLVVDDDPDIRTVVALLLEEEGFSVVTATNGQEALTELAQHQPAVVLLDLNMPVMSGWELHARLREDTQPPPIVFMTAGQHACTEAARYGADDCLPKPFGLDDLLRVVLRFTTDSVGCDRQPKS